MRGTIMVQEMDAVGTGCPCPLSTKGVPPAEGVRTRSSLNVLPLAIGDVFHQYNEVMVITAFHALGVPRACHEPPGLSQIIDLSRTPHPL